jgi:hypothetical protein
LKIHFPLLNPTELHQYRVTCIILLIIIATSFSFRKYFLSSDKNTRIHTKNSDYNKLDCSASSYEANWNIIAICCQENHMLFRMEDNRPILPILQIFIKFRPWFRQRNLTTNSATTFYNLIYVPDLQIFCMGVELDLWY